MLTLHSRKWKGQTMWKFQIRYFFQCLISSFNFHLDLLATFLKIQQKHIFPPCEFTHKRLFATDVQEMMTNFGGLIRNKPLGPDFFRPISSQSRLNYESETKKGSNMWPGRNAFQCRIGFLWRTFQSKIEVYLLF